MFIFGPLRSLILQASNNAMGSFTSTAETSLFPSVVGQRSIPANWFQPGFNARLVMRGTVSTPLVAGTTTVRLKIGGSTVATATTTSLLGSLSAQAFSVVCNLQCYTAGTTGTFGIGGVVTYPTGLLGVGMGQSGLNGTATFDSTVNQSLDVTGQWNLSSHTVQVNISTLELMGM